MGLGDRRIEVTATGGRLDPAQFLEIADTLDAAAPMLVPRKPFAPRDYVELTAHFVCNLKCEHCMIEGTMERLAPQSFAQFKRVAERVIDATYDDVNLLQSIQRLHPDFVITHRQIIALHQAVA